jgi:cysteine desulfurase
VTIYLDHAATSPLRPEVLAAYTEALQMVGNPSSIHSAGQSARAVLEDARERLAAVVGCDRNEVIFTSGGTEANNLAIKGLYAHRGRKLIITAATEHHAVLDAVEYLETQGAEIHWLSVSADGVIDMDELARVLEERHQDVSLIALMWVNNETGAITPIEAVTALAEKYGVPVHSDGVASFQHMPTNFSEAGLSTMAITAHKLGGPVGFGALIVSRATELTPLFHGGGQERALRAGTMDAAGAVAFAVASETPQPDYSSLEALAVELISPMGKLTRGATPGVPNILSFTFEGCSGESMLFLLDEHDIAVSNGSACTAGVARASHVLLAMGHSQESASSALRISFGPETTRADIEALAEALPNVVATARKI